MKPKFKVRDKVARRFYEDDRRRDKPVTVVKVKAKIWYSYLVEGPDGTRYWQDEEQLSRRKK